MKIEWNKVTWYSKLVALALFVALPFIGFWYGAQYGETVQLLNSPGGQISSGAPALNDYYTNVASWQIDQRPDGGFSIARPLDFNSDDNYSITPVTDWRINAPNSEPGIKMLTIMVPAAFEPQTNFVDATLTVGKSGNNAARTDCLKPDQSSGPRGSALNGATTTINGIVFSIFKSSGAGAGNYYDTTSYRTIHASQCYAVEYTIHSSQIANYPAEYNLKPFDQNQIASVLDRIVGTFKFQ